VIYKAMLQINNILTFSGNNNASFSLDDLFVVFPSLQTIEFHEVLQILNPPNTSVFIFNDATSLSIM